MVEIAGRLVEQGVGAVIQPEFPARPLGPDAEQRALFKYVVPDAARVVSENVVVPARCAMEFDGKSAGFGLLGYVS